MKNTTFFICFLLLTIFLHEAQALAGIKSRKVLTISTDSKFTTSLKKHTKIQASTSEANVNGKISTSTTTISKQEEHSEKRETFSVKSSPVVKQQKAAPKQYPDVLDIAGMDYSPARRKSPIHN